MWGDVLGLLAGLLTLVFSADRFIAGSASIARNFGVSPLLIGLTIVGFGTSAPEILVSGIASWQGNSGLAIGNALGSNIANIGLILGCTAVVAPVAIHSKMLKRELPILLVTCVACYLLVADNYYLGVADAFTMLAGLLVFMFWLIHTAVRERSMDPYSRELESDLPEVLPNLLAWLYFFIGLAGLLLSSRLLVWSAVNIANFFGISDLVIGLTIVALGTSLPELAATVSSVLKKEDDLAIGNIIGSNMYNMLAVYSLPGLIAPGAVLGSVVDRDFPVMLAFTAVLFVLARGRMRKGKICRLEGMALLLAYLGYQWLVYRQAAGYV